MFRVYKLDAGVYIGRELVKQHLYFIFIDAFKGFEMIGFFQNGFMKNSGDNKEDKDNPEDSEYEPGVF